MSLLSNFRVLTKILSIALLMAAVTVTISWVGIKALDALAVGADNMQAAATRSLAAARANQDVIALNRAEFRAALDPRPENRDAALKVVEENRKLFIERLDDVAKTRDDQARSMLPAVKGAFAEYERDAQDTFRLVSE